MTHAADLVRAVAVAVTALTQVLAAPVTTLALGAGSETGAISDANASPITPAGYAFAIWGLIYLGGLVLGVYQLTPTQRGRAVHRRTGWWLVGAFTASTVWVPIFGARLVWLSEIVIIALVGMLSMATLRLTQARPATSNAERWCLRLPVTLYLGWATLAATAGFGTMLRSLGMAGRGPGVTAVCLVLLVGATAYGVVLAGRITAAAGFVFTAAWALVAVAVATPELVIRIAALLAVVLVVGALATRVSRSGDRRSVLLG